jgi:hypothetical protein
MEAKFVIRSMVLDDDFSAVNLTAYIMTSLLAPLRRSGMGASRRGRLR